MERCASTMTDLEQPGTSFTSPKSSDGDRKRRTYENRRLQSEQGGSEADSAVSSAGDVTISRFVGFF